MLTWGLGVVATALFIALGCRLRGLSPPIFRAQLTFSESDFWEVVGAWQRSKQLSKVQEHFSLDYLFLLSYGCFGHALASELLRGSNPFGAPLTLVWPWLLPVAAAFDGLENVLHQYFLRSGRGKPCRVLYLIAGTSASAKWLVISAYFATLSCWVWRALTSP